MQAATCKAVTGLYPTLAKGGNLGQFTHGGIGHVNPVDELQSLQLEPLNFFVLLISKHAMVSHTHIIGNGPNGITVNFSKLFFIEAGVLQVPK